MGILCRLHLDRLGQLITTWSLKDIYLASEVEECMLSKTSINPCREFCTWR